MVKLNKKLIIKHSKQFATQKQYKNKTLMMIKKIVKKVLIITVFTQKNKIIKTQPYQVCKIIL